MKSTPFPDSKKVSRGRLALYNDLVRKIETFRPRDPDRVTVYVCGITPYDTTHLGHAFTYSVFDTLIRYLEFCGYPVQYAMNVTDVDDDILRKARETGEDWKEMGNRWTARFIEDMGTLGIRPPDYFPRATDRIAEIIGTVEKLIRAGWAYPAGGSVYFRIASWPEYGKLSRLSREEMLPVANERGNHPEDPNKSHPLDFVLWQAAQPGEPAWNSPWGPGRPGWHIECSTMAAYYLGDTLDIHGGGEDLIFPHHESEMAQAEGATGEKPFVRFWMHAAMVYQQGEKMSKSLGNLVLVNHLLKTRSPDAVRLYLAGHHYRKAWEHSEEELAQAEELARILLRAVRAAGGQKGFLDPAPKTAAFVSAMDRDLGTPRAVGVLRELAEEILEGAQTARRVGDAQDALRRLGGLFGLKLDGRAAEPAIRSGWDEHLKRFPQNPGGGSS